MKIHRLFLTLLGCVALLSVARADTATDDPVVMLRAGVDEGLAIAYDTQSTTPLADRIRPSLEKYFTFEGITRRAVGPGWRQFSAEEKTKATQLFSDLVIRTYANKFEPGPRPVISFGKTIIPDSTRPNLRELPTTITYEGKAYSVSYRVEQVNGTWKVYDMNIEGVSMIANWRAQLDPIFQKGGVKAVISALEKNIPLATPELKK
ncbi:MAG: ABC transporter substrate-binding protein [Rariglobus sp.]